MTAVSSHAKQAGNLGRNSVDDISLIDDPTASSHGFPFHVNEAPAMLRFMNWLIGTALITMILCSYTLSWVFKQHTVLAEMLPFYHTPMISERLRQLAAFDDFSQYSYLATQFTFFIMAPVLVLAMWIGYWRLVVRRGLARPVGRKEMLTTAKMIAITAISYWGIFFWPLDMLPPGRPGATRLLMWPCFPFIGSCCGIFLCALTFGATVGVFKYLSQRFQKEDSGI